MGENNASQFSPDSIAVTLAQLPQQLYQSDAHVAEQEQTIRELEESLQIAEINASLNAQTDGKDAATRELQRKQAVAKDTAVIAAKSALQGSQWRLEDERANNKQLIRLFAAYCHIADLKAAQMNLMSKGVTQK